ncbi:hypothetical protein, partial [Streptomyces sp. NPDC051098]|uniref:hypothetical protein n=1 Tax=Streptomyces sp. NPDC051098 TaxID=3155411 RepID=UPI00342DD6E9
MRRDAAPGRTLGSLTRLLGNRDVLVRAAVALPATPRGPRSCPGSTEPERIVVMPVTGVLFAFGRL